MTRVGTLVSSNSIETSLILFFFRDGTLVSGDSSGSTQFWDGEVGTLLQAQKRNQGDVLALASPPQQDVVFAAGIDGQITMYQRASEASVTGKVETTGKSYTERL